MSKGIAFFDFDGTITTKDTYLEFIRFAKGDFRFFTGFLLNSPIMAGYLAKVVPHYVAKERMLTHFFKGAPLAEFQTFCDRFSDQVVPALIRSGALKEIKTLQSNGVTVVIVSASFGNWIQKWATSLNLDLIATLPEIKDGKLTGKIDGKNCHGEEKVRRIKEKFNLPQYAEIHAYGDTSGDKPMLALANHAHYKPFR